MKYNAVAEELFDLSWYQSESGMEFTSKFSALDHYVSTGEKENLFPNPVFDPGYYRAEYCISDESNAFIEFCADEDNKSKNPNSFFYSCWYSWQNPESSAYLHPVHHYLKVGGDRFLDPAPIVDMTLLKRTGESSSNGVMLLSDLIKGKVANDLAISGPLSTLVCRQKTFIDQIDFSVLRELTESSKKYLVWVQCRPGTEFFNWFKESSREWDLLLNYYDMADGILDIGEYIISQNGTKFTAIFNVWRYTNIFEKYDYILFIDDDLGFKYKSIDKYFKFIDKHNLDLSQPSLTPGSYCVWPILFNKKSNGYRKTNGVEIMMPAFSRKAINLLAAYFSYSVSGFGLDLLFAKLAEQNDFNVGVVDAVKATHYSAIDQNEGAYYELLRRYGINSKYELWSLLTRFNLDKHFYEIPAS